MKKIFSLLLVLLLSFTCVPVGAEAREASAAYKTDDTIVMFPACMDLPMFSTSSGERLRVMQDGAVVPAGFFTWTSSDTGIVRVSPTGALTPVAAGTAVITATDEDGESASAVVNVVPDEGFTTIADLEMTDLSLPFYSEEVGIGPLGGGTPVILKRVIVPPSCGNEPEPDPNAYIASNGWTYTYATLFRFHTVYGQSIRFETSQSGAEGPHAANAYICIFDRYFNLWSYSRGTASNPFGQLTLDSYEESDFYLAVMPIDHTQDSASGNICLYAYDVTQPYAMGDVNRDHFVTSSDALIVMRSVMGLAELPGGGFELADINGDGAASADDALAIIRIAMNIAF